MTPRGFEPLIPPWKGGVLTAWPWSRIKKYKNELEQLSYCPISILITPRVGLEPTTTRLTAECSAIELLRIMESGSDLSSRAVSSQVLSALESLTSVFGMGTGGTSPSLPPEMVAILLLRLSLLAFILLTCVWKRRVEVERGWNPSAPWQLHIEWFFRPFQLVLSFLFQICFRLTSHCLRSAQPSSFSAFKR